MNKQLTLDGNDTDAEGLVDIGEVEEIVVADVTFELLTSIVIRFFLISIT